MDAESLIRIRHSYVTGPGKNDCVPVLRKEISGLEASLPEYSITKIKQKRYLKEDIK
jgi:hypothetical protein